MNAISESGSIENHNRRSNKEENAITLKDLQTITG